MDATKLARWTRVDGMMDLEGFGPLFDGLQGSVATLSRIVHGVLIHLDWLPAYGLEAARHRRIFRETLPVAERVRAILELDAGPIDISRPPALRVAGTCRDFALLLCALLRRRGIPARLRCGFGSYFAEGWEDHWVCEYWDADAGLWRLADAQVDDVLKARHHIRFDPVDVPRDVFMTADQAWLRCRGGQSEFRDFGQGETRGQWFMHVNVQRDGLALSDIATSAWDGWREATQAQRRPTDAEIAMADAIAARPDHASTAIAPGWLAP